MFFLIIKDKIGKGGRKNIIFSNLLKQLQLEKTQQILLIITFNRLSLIKIKFVQEKKINGNNSYNKKKNTKLLEIPIQKQEEREKKPNQVLSYHSLSWS